MVASISSNGTLMEATWIAGQAQVEDSGSMEEIVACVTLILNINWMTRFAATNTITFANSNAHPPLPLPQQQQQQQQLQHLHQVIQAYEAHFFPRTTLLKGLTKEARIPFKSAQYTLLLFSVCGPCYKDSSDRLFEHKHNIGGNTPAR